MWKDSSAFCLEQAEKCAAEARAAPLASVGSRSAKAGEAWLALGAIAARREAEEVKLLKLARDKAAAA